MSRRFAIIHHDTLHAPFLTDGPNNMAKKLRVSQLTGKEYL